jgi:hypothetical protein
MVLPVNQCTAMVVWGIDGRLHAPRRCVKLRTSDRYCPTHDAMFRRRPEVDITPSGFCVCCAGAAITYSVGDAKIALCRDHGNALAKAIREGR